MYRTLKKDLYLIGTAVQAQGPSILFYFQFHEATDKDRRLHIIYFLLFI